MEEGRWEGTREEDGKGWGNDGGGELKEGREEDVLSIPSFQVKIINRFRYICQANVINVDSVNDRHGRGNC